MDSASCWLSILRLPGFYCSRCLRQALLCRSHGLIVFVLKVTDTSKDLLEDDNGRLGRAYGSSSLVSLVPVTFLMQGCRQLANVVRRIYNGRVYRATAPFSWGEEGAMSVWMTLLAALGPALGKALYEVGKTVVAEPLMEPATEQLKERVMGGYEKRVDAAKVREAVQAAGEASDLAEWEDLPYQLQRAFHRLGEKGRDTLRESTVAAALAMRNGDPAQVPDGLLKALDVDERYRADLASFLWSLREALARADEDYGELVTLTHQDAVRQRLRAIALGVERLGSTVVGTASGPAVRTKPVSRASRKVEASYLKAVMARCSTLPLGGRDFRDSTPLGLSMPLEKVYVALNTTEQPPEARERAREIGDLPEAREMKRISALRAFIESKHLLLLGEPGSGKTTFADHLALCLAGERRNPGTGWAGNLKAHDVAWKGRAPLPIRIRLRHFAADRESLPADSSSSGQAEHLLAYVTKRLEKGHYDADLPPHVLHCLQTGDALLILDGLDEIGDPGRRQQVAEAIVDLARHRYPDIRLLVTCRVRQYPMDSAGCPMAAWALPGFRVVTLADFDRDQIDAFVGAWFTVLYELDRFSEEVRDQKTQSLRGAIRVRPDLQDIAPRPILLTQMALVHDIEGELPATRVQLYDVCADLLLWKWEQWRAKQAGQQLMAEDWIRERMDMPGLRKDDLQRALDHAVYKAHEGQGAADKGPTDIPEETLRRLVCECLQRTDRRMPNHEAVGKAQLFIDEYLRLRNGLIVPAGEHTFQTPHRTFQEFLAARWLHLDRRFDRTAPALVRDSYDLWREVFLLAVGQARLGDAVDAVDLLCPAEWPDGVEGWRELILAGQGLAEVGLPKARSDERGPTVERSVVGFLQRTMQDADAAGQPYRPPTVPVPTRYAASETLDRLGWLPEDLDAFVVVPKARSEVSVYVGKYPVTNHQFTRFIDAEAYNNPAYWGGTASDAWRWRMEKHDTDWRGEGPVAQPKYWDHPRFGKGRRGYPVVGVSWYEAVAYCVWLEEQLQASDLTLCASRGGGLEPLDLEPATLTVRLPSEEEWVAAAGGEEGGRYPWGSNWHESRANTAEGGIGGTSPVGMYPSGRSRDARSGELIGVWDMGGNVWEWVASEEGLSPLRGGSWLNLRYHARVTRRLRLDPHDSRDYIGFRVVVSPVGPGC
jgi:formylglycine-generating enzyme required for sulfatase activity